MYICLSHPPFCYTIFQKAGSSFFQSKLGVDRFQTHYRKLDFFFCSSNSNKELIPYYGDICIQNEFYSIDRGNLAVLRVILSDESGYKKFGTLGLTFTPFSKFCNLFYFEKSSKLGKTKWRKFQFQQFFTPSFRYPKPSLLILDLPYFHKLK